MSISEAQRDMRAGYLSGAPGILASGLVWAVATIIAFVGDPETAIWALLIGGMLIHPVGVVIAKLLGSRAAHTKSA